jgi:hypothetical protein
MDGQVPVTVGNIVGVVPPPLPVWGVPPDVLLWLVLLVPLVLPTDDPLLSLVLLPAVGVAPDTPPRADDPTFPDEPLPPPPPEKAFEVPSPDPPGDEVDSCAGAARPVGPKPHAIPKHGTMRAMTARRGTLTGWRMDSPPARKARE